ncbi:MAG TPA: pilus assembly PilX N-terminal domain-containing protein, partial [Pyrinomonadaceae bacterium]|nr:pilus assembly PilX N-terminal domain-containing protein [Pyrinomonadaceae bacterium]
MFVKRKTWKKSEKGSAVILALFVLALVGAFVALALTRTATEAAASGNEAAEGRTFYAAQGSLEMMTRNFNKIFETKLSPTNFDQDRVRNGTVPGLVIADGGQFTFLQELQQTSKSRSETLSGGPYSGLFALRDNWRLRTTATDGNTRTQVQLTRNILNNRIPIFQFGVFYEDDLELFRPPLFSFGGRVHSNRHFFISPGSDGVYFDSRVTAHGQIVTQSWRNGYTGDNTNNQTFIKNASGVNKQLLPTEGSVLNGTPNIFASDPDLPSSKRNTSFLSQTAKFDGNLQAEVPELKLPLKVAGSPDLSEMIRRGKAVPDANGGDLVNNSGTVEAVSAATVDGDIMKAERFANKTGIRVSLADSKAKLPGCASGSGTAAVSTPCGVRLDGSLDGSGADPANV